MSISNVNNSQTFTSQKALSLYTSPNEIPALKRNYKFTYISILTCTAISSAWWRCLLSVHKALFQQYLFCWMLNSETWSYHRQTSYLTVLHVFTYPKHKIQNIIRNVLSNTADWLIGRKNKLIKDGKPNRFC